MKSNKLDLLMKIMQYGLVAIGVILCLLVINGPNAEQTTMEIEKFRDGASLGAAIGFTGILMFACAGVVILFFLVQLITNTKKTVFSIIGIIIALVIYLLFSVIGTGDTNDSLGLWRTPVSASTISSTSAGLYTVLVGLVISVLAIVLGPVMGRMRK